MSRAPATILGVLAALLLVSPAEAANDGETVEQALCRLIEGSAKAQNLPVPFLTRLIWRESAFRVTAVSPGGAQGVAQFMPGTARERGLLDPFDPEQAIPHAAQFLADLRKPFGNLGRAAAAYNRGRARVSAGLAGSGGLPAETRAYVIAITGRTAEDWRPVTGVEMPPSPNVGQAQGAKTTTKDETEPTEGSVEPRTCLQVTAALRIPSRGDRFALPVEGGPAAPWGIQLAGNFSKQLALASFARTRSRYDTVIGEVRPMIIGTRLRFRGSRAFYRVRIPAETRGAADALCGKIRQAGGACIVLRT